MYSARIVASDDSFSTSTHSVDYRTRSTRHTSQIHSELAISFGACFSLLEAATIHSAVVQDKARRSETPLLPIVTAVSHSLFTSIAIGFTHSPGISTCPNLTATMNPAQQRPHLLPKPLNLNTTPNALRSNSHLSIAEDNKQAPCRPRSSALQRTRKAAAEPSVCLKGKPSSTTCSNSRIKPKHPCAL
jgi:hypothetical protein